MSDSSITWDKIKSVLSSMKVFLAVAFASLVLFAILKFFMTEAIYNMAAPPEDGSNKLPALGTPAPPGNR